MAKRVRVQASKRYRVRNEELGRAMIELRKGSRTSPHRNKTVYSRRDRWEDYDV